MKNRNVNNFLIEKIIKDKNYKIYKNGKIKTLIGVNGKKSSLNQWRYNVIKKTRNGLSIKYKKKRILLHRIIYRKFIGKFKKNYVINHKNHNPYDNKIKNLEQISVSENNRHRFKKGYPIVGNFKINYQIAEEIRILYKTGKYTYDQLKIKYKLKSKSIISYIINDKIWKKDYSDNKILVKCSKPNAQPKWVDVDKIRKFYKNKPKGKVVDHIIPLNGEHVSGLHIFENLQYLSNLENTVKHNSFDFTKDNNSWKLKLKK